MSRSFSLVVIFFLKKSNKEIKADPTLKKKADGQTKCVLGKAKPFCPAE